MINTYMCKNIYFIYYNILQHITTYYNILQHITTYYNN